MTADGVSRTLCFQLGRFRRSSCSRLMQTYSTFWCTEMALAPSWSLLHVTFDHTKLKRHGCMPDSQETFERHHGHLLFRSLARLLARPGPKSHSGAQKGPSSHQIPRVVGLSSMQEALGAHIFQGPHPILTVQEIYRDVFRLFAANFFICIDIIAMTFCRRAMHASHFPLLEPRFWWVEWDDCIEEVKRPGDLLALPPRETGALGKPLASLVFCFPPTLWQRHEHLPTGDSRGNKH